MGSCSQGGCGGTQHWRTLPHWQSLPPGNKAPGHPFTLAWLLYQSSPHQARMLSRSATKAHHFSNHVPWHGSHLCTSGHQSSPSAASARSFAASAVTELHPSATIPSGCDARSATPHLLSDAGWSWRQQAQQGMAWPIKTLVGAHQRLPVTKQEVGACSSFGGGPELAGIQCCALVGGWPRWLYLARNCPAHECEVHQVHDVTLGPLMARRRR